MNTLLNESNDDSSVNIERDTGSTEPCKKTANNLKVVDQYEDAGVSIERGNELVRRLKKITHSDQAGVMGNLGGFGALFDIGSLNYQHPILVSGTDGVGTKIKLAIEHRRHDRIGIDLVAMCVNDLIVQGAKPLFFLDYFACSKLDVDVAESVVNGIVTGCKMAGCSLIGGETAEMPDMYQTKDYDLAGFCVGIVEKDNLITGQNVAVGDTLIALASDGCHANGYSLIRKIIKPHDVSIPIAGQPLLERLLTPTRIYVKPLLGLIEQLPIKAIAHITGGGLTENIPRVIPDQVAAKIETLPLPAIFEWLQQQGQIELSELYKTFNCGVGMVICVAPSDQQAALDYLNHSGETAWRLGTIIDNDDPANKVRY